MSGNFKHHLIEYSLAKSQSNNSLLCLRARPHWDTEVWSEHMLTLCHSLLDWHGTAVGRRCCLFVSETRDTTPHSCTTDYISLDRTAIKTELIQYPYRMAKKLIPLKERVLYNMLTNSMLHYKSSMPNCKTDPKKIGSYLLSSGLYINVWLRP